MQENAIYTVISPEGCAAILWRDAGEAQKAAAAFKPDAAHCLELGVIDAIVPEPAGGAHTDADEAARLLGDALARVARASSTDSPATSCAASAVCVSAQSARCSRNRAEKARAERPLSTSSTGLSPGRTHVEAGL